MRKQWLAVAAGLLVGLAGLMATAGPAQAVAPRCIANPVTGQCVSLLPHYVKGTNDNRLWEWTGNPNGGGTAIRHVPNGHELDVMCQANNGPQEDNMYNVYPSVPSRTWDFAWDPSYNQYVWVYDWWMDTPPQNSAYNWYSWSSSSRHCNF